MTTILASPYGTTPDQTSVVQSPSHLWNIWCLEVSVLHLSWRLDDSDNHAYLPIQQGKTYQFEQTTKTKMSCRNRTETMHLFLILI